MKGLFSEISLFTAATRMILQNMSALKTVNLSFETNGSYNQTEEKHIEKAQICYFQLPLTAARIVARARAPANRKVRSQGTPRESE